MKNKIEISPEEFKAYEEVRQSGLTNMFDVNKVIELSRVYLTSEKIFEIMKNYSELKKQYYEN